MEPIRKSVKTNEYDFDMEVKYTSSDTNKQGGSTINISITIPYNQFKTFSLPSSCDKCPAGYCTKEKETDEGCGRNVPWTDIDYKDRPKTCKLSKANILDIIAENI